MAKDSAHTQAVTRTVDDMKKVIDSMNDAPFMDESVSPDAARKHEMFAAMAPDLKALLEGGMPQYMVERLARSDLES